MDFVYSVKNRSEGYLPKCNEEVAEKEKIMCDLNIKKTGVWSADSNVCDLQLFITES